MSTSPASGPGGAPGWLALVGGGEWRAGCEPFDRRLVELSGSRDVLVLPTAAAYEQPEKAVATAVAYFEGLGAEAQACMVLRRADAEDQVKAAQVRAAPFIYLSGGSVLHLRSVLKSSAVWDALVAAWSRGAVLAGSSAGAMVLGDTMVDPRGGALTLGLGLVRPLAVLPHAGTWGQEKTERTVKLANAGVRIAAIPEGSAVLRSPTGQWEAMGQGLTSVWVDGEAQGLEALEQCQPG